MSIFTINGSPLKYGNKWIGQDDAPPSELPEYDSGDAGKVLKVNSGGTGLEWDEETGTEYTAGNGIDITGDVISVDTTVVATQTDLADKQDVLTAGDNITITNNVISATAAPQQQADWTETDPTDVSYIQNKPTIPSGNQLLPAATSADEDKVLTVDSNGDPIWSQSAAQVQSDWTEQNSAADSYIQHKPTVRNLIAGTGITITETAQGIVISLS
jgi:hypothetical protein